MSKNGKKIFVLFQTDFKVSQMPLHLFFKGFFRNIVLRSVAFVTKKLWAILDFFTQIALFTALYPTVNFFKKNFSISIH